MVQRTYQLVTRTFTSFPQYLRAAGERNEEFLSRCGAAPKPHEMASLFVPDDATPETYDAEPILPLSQMIDEAFDNKFPLLTGAQLDAKRFEQRDLIPGILAAGKPGGIFGGFKTLKTTLALDLLISIASGTPFLGRFPVAQPGKVLYLSGSGDGGLDAVQAIARRICAERGLALESLDNLMISPKLPRLDARIDLMVLRELFEKQKPVCVVIDPAHLAIGNGNPRNLFAMGQMLAPLAELCESSGCTVLLVHDCKRAMKAGAPATLDDVAWGGFAGYAAQWLMLSRRMPFDLDTGRHELWLTTGSRTGRRSLWALDVDEGPPPRFAEGTAIAPLMTDVRPWQPKLRAVTWAEAGAQAEERVVATSEDRRIRRRDLAAEYQGKRILILLADFPNGGLTQRQIRDRLGFSGERMTRLLETLEMDGRVVKNEEELDGRRKRVTYSSSLALDFQAPPDLPSWPNNPPRSESGTGPQTDRENKPNFGRNQSQVTRIGVIQTAPIAAEPEPAAPTEASPPSAAGRDTSKDREMKANSPKGGRHKPKRK